MSLKFIFFLSITSASPGLSLPPRTQPADTSLPCDSNSSLAVLSPFQMGRKGSRTAIASDQKYMSLSASPYEVFGRSRVMKNNPNQCYLSQNYSWWATGLTALAAVCLFISYLGEFMTAQELMVVVYMWRYCSLTSALYLINGSDIQYTASCFMVCDKLCAASFLPSLDRCNFLS